jgi:MYXO-CTERM domain-containing protein
MTGDARGGPSVDGTGVTEEPPEEGTDAGRGISMRKPDGPKLYAGPACAFTDGSPAPGLPMVLVVAGLLRLRRRRR